MVTAIPVRFLNAGLRYARLICLAGVALAATFVWDVTATDERVISMYNIHTKETLTIAYKRNGAFIPEAMEKLSRFMRDWRREESHKMDPELIDLMWSLHAELGSKEPMHLISGYRSPHTNNSLRHAGGGVARFSQHMLGKAADIQFPDIPLKQLRYAALIHEAGGVGYYPTSGMPFVHVDTGSVRAWPRLPRMELALLFPSGRSRHLPQDGRTLTRDDARVAMASLRSSGGELPLAVRRHSHPAQSGPILANYSPGSSPFGKIEKAVDKRLALPARDSGDAGKRQETEPQAVALLAPPVAQSQFSPGQLEPGAASADEVATVSSEYDDEDPDEINYQPFPLAPLMTEASVAAVDFEDGPRVPVVATPAMIFGEANSMLSVKFNQGLQYANLFWASRFAAGAVDKALASQAAQRSLIVASAKRQQKQAAPAAVASVTPQKAPAKAAMASMASMTSATPPAAAKPQTGKQPEKATPQPSSTVAAASVAAPSSSDNSDSGSSIWSSIFSAPSVSYGFNGGQ
jgi:uncharacterized protein YcbK (DUF882 family)